MVKMSSEMEIKFVPTPVKAVIEGKSKRKVFSSQAEVAELFMHDKEAYTQTRNFRSEPPLLMHYNVVQAVKTKDDVIIVNNECWSAGFAYCTWPPKYNYIADLSSIRELLLIDNKGLANLQVLDAKKESWPGTILFRIPVYLYNWIAKAYEFIGVFYVLNEVGNFVAILEKPCKTIEEAYESMKPDVVKEYEKKGLVPYRQGEWFFIPFNKDPRLIEDIKSIEKEWYIDIFRKCPICGKVAKWLPYKCYKHTRDAKKEIDIVEVKRYWLKFPRLEDYSNHCARKVGKYKGLIVALGPIRHMNRDHEILRVEGWYYALKNIVKKAISTRTRGGD